MIQPIRGGFNSIIMCQLMVMMLVRPLFAVVTTSILDPAAFVGSNPDNCKEQDLQLVAWTTTHNQRMKSGYAGMLMANIRRSNSSWNPAKASNLCQYPPTRQIRFRIRSLSSTLLVGIALSSSSNRNSLY